jgi:hypothetical protein
MGGSVPPANLRAGAHSPPASARRPGKESQPMLDVLMLMIGIGFFALAVAYAFACDRL